MRGLCIARKLARGLHAQTAGFVGTEKLLLEAPALLRMFSARKGFEVGLWRGLGWRAGVPFSTRGIVSRGIRRPDDEYIGAVI